MTLRALLATAIVLLSSCAVPEASNRTGAAEMLPPMRGFAATRAAPPTRSNAEIARDFLDLSFMLESGRALPRFTRFEGPISLRVLGDSPASLDTDLGQLLERLRVEAGIDIRRVPGNRAANVTVQVIPRETLQRTVPAAACFVVPRVTDWRGFLRNRRGPEIDWTTLERRDRLAIFVPGDVAPQELRDCLHEELAQALGPLNDLYRLTDSVFNDDNFHTVLTGFDMLILRATYAPELRSGMTRAEVARRLPGVLDRLNPAGARGGSAPADPPSPDWSAQIEEALGPGASDQRRREAAARALGIARARGWEDNRLAFSFFALGRLSLADAPDLALGAYLRAAEIYDRDPATRVHGAHVAVQLAAFALSAGQPESAIEIVDAHTGAVIEAQNAALLSTLLMVKAEALRDTGRVAAARRLRGEALGWARYGYGDPAEIRRRADEIADLAPNRRNTGS